MMTLKLSHLYDKTKILIKSSSLGLLLSPLGYPHTEEFPLLTLRILEFSLTPKSSKKSRAPPKSSLFAYNFTRLLKSFFPWKR